jgi:hypothetical protein
VKKIAFRDNNMTINEIRKEKFIKNQTLEDFSKLYQYAQRCPEFFDDVFLMSSFSNALNAKNITGITYIAQLYIVLNRLIEADYLLNTAIKRYPDEQILLYFLSDISSRRHIFFSSNYFCEELKKKEGKILYAKAQIKFYLLQGYIDSIDSFIYQTFTKYCFDYEYCILVFEACKFTKNQNIAYDLFSCNNAELLYQDLNERNRKIAKSILLKKLIQSLKRIKNAI